MTKDHLVFNGKKWVLNQLEENQVFKTTVNKKFSEICYYYANVVDYLRCFLGVLACVQINLLPQYQLFIAANIMLNTLLDWIDGPLARNYGQCSVMGCGWDWFADTLA